MNYLIYISAAKKLMDEPELLEILEVSRKNNQAKNITGMLIYGEGTFIQVIEGNEEDLENLYNKIERDPRHKNLIKLTDGALGKRNFADWSMGFKSVNAEELKMLEGYIDPKSEKFLGNDNPHTAISVLKTFAQNNNISS